VTAIKPMTIIKDSVVEDQFDSTNMERLRQGDIDVFEELFRVHFSPLLQFAFEYVNDVADAENIVQEVLYNVWKNRRYVNPQLNIKTYLFTAVKNQSLKYLKHQKVHHNFVVKQVSLHTDDDSPEKLLLYKELETAVQTVIDNLPDKCRMIFCMNRFDRLTYKEIATIQGISIKTVEKYMTRAFKILRRQLSHLIISIPF
jgi:RNA polymerase sigma-70 factor (ECF subfamily)